MTATAPAPDAVPGWDLGDLYAGLDDPRIAADLSATLEAAKAFADHYRGKLVALAARAEGGQALAAAVAAYEALGDRTGRIAAYAGLSFAARSSDAEVAKMRPAAANQ